MVMQQLSATRTQRRTLTRAREGGNCHEERVQVLAYLVAAGVSGPPLTWRAPPGKQFTTTRRLRPGYDPEQC